MDEKRFEEAVKLRGRYERGNRRKTPPDRDGASAINNDFPSTGVLKTT